MVYVAQRKGKEFDHTYRQGHKQLEFLSECSGLIAFRQHASHANLAAQNHCLFLCSINGPLRLMSANINILSSPLPNPTHWRVHIAACWATCNTFIAKPALL